jgi:hypothetical protein
MDSRSAPILGRCQSQPGTESRITTQVTEYSSVLGDPDPSSRILGMSYRGSPSTVLVWGLPFGIAW